MADADPTLSILERIKRPSEWAKVVRRIPVFCEHEVWLLPNGSHVAYMLDEPHKVGKFLYRVDREKLRETLERLEREIDETANLPLMTMGHRKDPLTTPQSEQPPVVGCYGNPILGQWGPKKKIGLLMDGFYEKGRHFAAAGKMPHRSPEWYPKTAELTSVALLNTDPKLPLGLVTAYQRRDGAMCYGRGFDTMPDEPEDMGGETDPTVTPGADDGKPDGVFLKHFNKSADHEFPRLREMHAKHCEQYGAAPGGPGMAPVGGPPAPGAPGLLGPTAGAPPVLPPKEPPMAMSRDTAPETYQKAAFDEMLAINKGLLARMAFLEAENKTGKETYARAKVQADLWALSDPNREGGALTRLQDEKFFAAELERQVVIYARSPAEQDARVKEMDEAWEHTSPIAPDPTRAPWIAGGINYGRTADSQLPEREPSWQERLQRAEEAEQYMKDHSADLARYGERAFEMALDKVAEEKAKRVKRA